MSFYGSMGAQVIERLLAAHDPMKAIIRNRIIQAEYDFFQEHIREKNVLVCGSGLGHDAFELARYNNKIVGVERLDELHQLALGKQSKQRNANIVFLRADLMNLPRELQKMNLQVAVMNMGTICNFEADEHSQLMQQIMEVVEIFYFSFYPPIKKALKIRQKMYAEEYWAKVSLQGSTLVSEDGLYSRSYTKNHFYKITDDLGCSIEFHQFLDFMVMAEVSR